MTTKLMMSIVALIAIIGFLLPGCSSETPANGGAEVRTNGPFLDEVLVAAQPDESTAIQQLRNGALDVCACDLSDSETYAEVVSDSNLSAAEGVRILDELTFNPVGPTFPETGKLNPFSVPKLREAMHWLIDRDYIAQEIYGGLAIPRYTCLTDSFADAEERYPDLIAAVREKYAHDPAKAKAVITEEMEKLGAVLEGGKWMYNGEPVELIGLIRSNDQRLKTGDYVANQLEELGFTVTRQYGGGIDLGPVWQGDPDLGRWHFYTGAWINTVIARDESSNFGFFYTNLWSEGAAMYPLWRAYVNDPGFHEAARRLYECDYTTMEERAELFEICIQKSMEENQRMFLVTRTPFSPMRRDVRLAADTAGAVAGSWMWALTAHFVDDEGKPIVGGALSVAEPDTLADPWNPVAGSNQECDMFPIRATGDMGLQPDTRTGLSWPGRIEKAEVFVQAGLPATVTNTEWCSLTFVPQIEVPLDAWADWDAAEQRFITVAERFPEGTTALRKSVVYYPKDIFEVPLHDGSTLSMGDFVLYTILKFDRAKVESDIYDESYVAEFSDFMSAFKGIRFITDDPDYGLIVEYYSDTQEEYSYSLWQIDAELAVITMFPVYSGGPGLWHTVALGIKAEEDGVLAFSQAKSSTLGVEWMNFVDGPSLPILKSYLDSAKASNYIPYEPTMGLYVTEAEATERWANLEDWYKAKKHFWVASGPFYLEMVDTAGKVVYLKRFEEYPDPMDRWLFLLQPLS